MGAHSRRQPIASFPEGSRHVEHLDSAQWPSSLYGRVASAASVTQQLTGCSRRSCPQLAVMASSGARLTMMELNGQAGLRSHPDPDRLHPFTLECEQIGLGRCFNTDRGLTRNLIGGLGL